MNCESINGPDMGRTFIFYIGPVRPKVVIFGLGSGLEIFGPYRPLLTTILFLNYMTKIVIFILFFCMKQNCCSIKYQVFSCISHLDFEPEPKKKKKSIFLMKRKVELNHFFFYASGTETKLVFWCGTEPQDIFILKY